MTKQQLARKIYDVAYLTGDFKLRSGLQSHEYFDKYMYEAEPEILAEIAKHMSELVPEAVELLAGLEMGGIPLATAISLRNCLPMAFVRKKAKEYGTCKLAEGTNVADKNVCIIEDNVTTGGQIIDSVQELRKFGAKIDTVICVVLRNETAIVNLAEAGLRLFPLFTMDYIKQQVKLPE